MSANRALTSLDSVLRPASSTRRGWIAFLAICAVTLAIYFPVRNYPFVAIDDPLFVSRNPHVSSGLSLDGIRWAFSDSHYCNWIPLTWLSLMLDASLYGKWAGGYHLTNLCLHLANIGLLLAFVARGCGNVRRGAFVAAMFALHPLHVESVAWVSERKDVLSIFFGLLALNAYLRYVRARSGGWYFAVVVAFVCSLLAKQTLVTLPFLLLLLDYWPLGRFLPSGNPSMGSAGPAVPSPPISRLLLEKLPLLILSILFSVIVVVSQAEDHAIESFSELRLSARILNAILSYGIYLQKMLLPFDLAVFYPHPRENLSIAAVTASFVLLGVISATSIVNARRWPFLIVGWLWFLGTLFPMIGIVQVGEQQLADRYAYLPLIGMYIAIAWLVPKLTERRRYVARLLPAAAATVVLFCAGLASAQIGYWRDGETLIRHSLAVTADNPFARAVLGDALIDQGLLEEGIREYQAGIALAPDDPAAHQRFALILELIGQSEEAIRQYRIVLALDQTQAAPHYRMGLALLRLRRLREAREALTRSVQLDDDNAMAFAHLAKLWRSYGEFQKSLECGERALELDDSLLVCHHLVALNLRDLGRPDEADEHLRVVVEAEPDNERARADLRRVLTLAARRNANSTAAPGLNRRRL